MVCVADHRVESSNTGFRHTKESTDIIMVGVSGIPMASGTIGFVRNRSR